MSVPTPDEIAAAKASFLDFPTAWKIQREVGASLKHHPRCSSVPGWDPISGPAFLCDCGAVELEWHRRGRRVLLAALEQAEAKLAESERQRERLMEGDTYQAVLELDARLGEAEAEGEVVEVWFVGDHGAVRVPDRQVSGDIVFFDGQVDPSDFWLFGWEKIDPQCFARRMQERRLTLNEAVAGVRGWR